MSETPSDIAMKLAVEIRDKALNRQPIGSYKLTEMAKMIDALYQPAAKGFAQSDEQAQWAFSQMDELEARIEKAEAVPEIEQGRQGDALSYNEGRAAVLAALLTKESL